MNRTATNPFPHFLLPSASLADRKPSADLTSADESLTSSFGSALAAADPPEKPLDGHIALLRCGRCSVDLCLTSDIVSKGFTGRWGRAYLVSGPSEAGSKAAVAAAAAAAGPAGAHRRGNLPNTHVHKPVPRQLVTGSHTVSDVSCAFCGNILGWKYVAAEEQAQQYKVGKFILETKRVAILTDWERGGDGAGAAEAPAWGGGDDAGGDDAASDEVEFDSQDEDECEDLFSGLWSPESALKRRKAKTFRKTQRQRTRDFNSLFD